MKPEKIKRLKELRQTYRRCKKCRLHKSRDELVFGRGACKKRVVLVGEAPGPTEDQEGDPFVGRAGVDSLDKLLKIAKLKRNDVFIMNAVCCYPGRNDNGGFNKPTEEQIIQCAPRMKRTIEIIKPKIIVAMGNIALFSLTSRKGIAEHREKVLPFFGKCKAELIVTYHPSAVLRNPTAKVRAKGDFHELGEWTNSGEIFGRRPEKQKKKRKKKPERVQLC